jgi:electron transfer flavoprotein alpha/beta subunit
MEFLNQVKNPSFPQILQSNIKKVKHLTIEDIHRDVPRMGESVAKVAKPSSRKTTRGRNRDSKIL